MRNKRTSLKEDIIENSIKLFLRKGYNATRVEDITNATNVSKAAFYCHFNSKDELLETIVDRFGTLFVDRVIEEVRNAEGDFLRKLKYEHKWASNFAFSNKELCIGFVTIAGELAGSGTPTESRIKAISARYRNFLKELLEQGRREGAIKDDLDIDLAAHVINGIHDGMLIEWYDNLDQVDGAKLALAYRDIALRGILK